MNKQKLHNVLFHLHTVSGIIISVALFIIFFAGAFTMFKKEIMVWESGHPTSLTINDIDFDDIYKKLENNYNLTGRHVRVSIMHGMNNIRVYVDRSHLPEASAEELQTHSLRLDINDYKLRSDEESYTYAAFIYQLHFLNQLPYIGIYLAGMVAFFFLFALLTGLYIHWDKIARNFILFRPHAKWLTIWKDAHTVLGTIAFPFQFMFAVTGAFFCLSTLVLFPAYSLYHNDYEKLMNDMRPERAHEAWLDKSSLHPQSINKFFAYHQGHFQDFEVYDISIENINGSNMRYELIGDLSEKAGFTGSGAYTVDAYTLEPLSELDPYKFNYVSSIQRLMGRLHFGDYGGIYTKFIYAFLAFLTCFIIISGVMLWFTARDKKNVSEKRRKFNRKVVNIYLAICLSMIPVTAFGFMAAKWIPAKFAMHPEIYFSFIYFLSWLFLTLYFIYKNNFKDTLTMNLLLGGVLFLLVPVINALYADHWVWNIWHHAYRDIFVVDVLCLWLSAILLFTFFTLRKKHRQNC